MTYSPRASERPPIGVRLGALVSSALIEHERRTAIDTTRPVTYAEIRSMARTIADRLLRMEAETVEIHSDAGPWAYASFLGAIIAESVPCVIDPALPSRRQQQLRRVLVPDAVVQEDGTVRAVRTRRARDRVRHPGVLAYVSFTSGTTGDPKGVMVSGPGMHRFLRSARDIFPVSATDRFGEPAPISSDMHIVNLLIALTSGACFVPLTSPRERSFLGRVVAQKRISVMRTVPRIVDLMSRAREMTATNLESLRLVGFGGDVLLPHHLETLFKVAPRLRVVNTYGLTESTGFNLAQGLHRDDFRSYCGVSVALGAPLSDARVIIEPASSEIVLEGRNFGPGYCGDPEATATVFEGVPGARDILRLHTGDAGTVSDRGQLFISGRLNRVIKHVGFRVSLDELDAVASECLGSPAVAATCDGEIVLFVEGQSPPPVAQVRSAIGEILPSYALPTRVVNVHAIPLNAAGKPDHRALLELVSKRAGQPAG